MIAGIIRQAFLQFYHANQFLNDGINFTPQATVGKLAQLGGRGLLRGTSCSP